MRDELDDHLEYYCYLTYEYWCALLGILWEFETPVLVFFLRGILTDLFLSDRKAALAAAIFLILPDALFLSSLTSMVDRSSHQYS